MKAPVVLIRHPSAPEYARIIRQRRPQLRFEIADENRLAEQVARADILLGLRFPSQFVQEAKTIRWFQATGAGVDSVIPVADLLPGMIITNARGIHGDVIADYVLTGITMLKWDIRRIVADQAERQWTNRSVVPLSAMTIGVIGLGSIGGEVCRRAKAAGMAVIGFRRSPSLASDHADEVYAVNRLESELGRCDAVVLTVPKTVETAGMIGAAQFACMKRTAVLLNVSRGDIVREPDLVAALQDGIIGGAMLDVFQREPLPQESPLWSMPNVIVTPHMAGGAADYVERMLAIFFDNLDRFMAGQPLRNLVDPGRGY